MRLTPLVALLLGVSLLAGCGSSSSGGSGNAASTAAATSGATATGTSASGPSPLTSGVISAGAGGGATGTVVGSTAPGSTGVPSGTVGSGTSGSGGAPGTPGSGSTTPGSTTPAPSGPDLSPPLIALISPNRGTFTTLQAVVVEGTISDQTGVAYFLINGAPAAIAPGGAFRETVALTNGLNVITLQAADPLGHATQTALSVVSGTFLPESSVVADAVATRLNRPGFDAIERVAAQQLGGVSLATMIMAQNPLYSGSAGLASVQVDATQASFGTPALDLDPRQGGLYVKAELPNIDVTVRAHGQVLGIGYSVTTNVTADKATLEAIATVNVAAGVVTTQLTQVVVTLDNFRFDIGGVPTFLENLARNALRGLIERQVQRQVEQIVPQEINKAIAGANGPITQTVMGRPVTLHVIPTAVTFDPDGCTVTADADMTMPPAPGVTLPTTPGSLWTAGALPTLGTQRAVYLSANDDLLNRIGHAAWRGGLMNLKIDQAYVQQHLSLPSWVSFDAFLLQVFFPQLVGVVSPTDPLELEIGALTPPIFQTKPAPGLLEAGIGDLTLSIYVAPVGQQRRLVLATSLQVKLDVAPSVSNGTLRVALGGRPVVVTDVHSTLVPMNQTAVENIVDFLVPPVLQLLVASWSGFPLPTHPAVTPSNVDLLRDGPALDFITIRGDL
ncbi:MAG: hypothetical protein AB7N76_01865 [Planctomycetota bacterium]